MISVLVATSRAAHCYTHHSDWNQFEILGAQLSRQNYRDFELVLVTPFVDEARASIGSLVERLTIVEPRDTPWRRARMFAAASARNTGLAHVHGDWVLVMDDCSEFDPHLLAVVAEWASRGTGVAVMYRRPDGTIHDGRWSLFQRRAHADHLILRNNDQPAPQGYLSFPTSAAVAINGYDEIRFDGARGLEDMNFSRRLMRYGVPFAMDRRAIVALHDHLGYPSDLIDNEDQNGRCCNTAHALAELGPANRRRYSPEEKRKILNCMYWKDSGKCGYHGHPCAYPKWAAHGHRVARRILENDEEELFDLAGARAANGL